MAHDVSDTAHRALSGDAAEPAGALVPAGNTALTGAVAPAVTPAADIAPTEQGPQPEIALGEPPLSERGLAGLAPPPPGAGAAVPWTAPPTAPQPIPISRPRRAYPNATRRPIIGLTALILVTLVAAFFGWVSAEPFWIAMGRGAQGTVTVTSCERSGLNERCVGEFVAEGREFTAEAVRLSSVPDDDRKKGASFQARMLDADSSWAYAGPASALHLRWELGVLIVVLCGILIGLVTGVRRLRSAGTGGRLLLWAVGLAGPLAIFAGMLVTAAL